MLKKLEYLFSEWLLPALFYGAFFALIGFMYEASAEDFPAKKFYRTGSQSQNFTTPESSCQALTGMTGWTYSGVTQGANYPQQPFWNCRWTNDSTGNASSQANVLEEYSCDGIGGTLSPTYLGYPRVCQNVTPCPDGQTRQPDGSCSVPPPTCEDKEGQTARSGLFEMGTSQTNFSTVACLNQCMLKFDGNIPGKEQLVNGKYHYYAEGAFIYNGFDCPGGTGSAPPGTTSLPPPSCGNGQTMGQINGKTACVGSGDGKPQNPHTPTETEKTEKTKTENPDGSTTETETTTRADGSSTTTTTTTNPDGSSTTTKTETPATGSSGAVSEQKEAADKEKKVDICAENPDIPACKEVDAGEAVDVEGLYESPNSEDKTFKVVMQTFTERVQNISWFKSIAGFFEVTMPGGSCGGMSGSVGFGGYSFDYDLDSVFCGPAAQTMYSVLSVGVQMAATWVAFSIAFLF